MERSEIRDHHCPAFLPLSDPFSSAPELARASNACVSPLSFPFGAPRTQACRGADCLPPHRQKPQRVSFFSAHERRPSPWCRSAANKRALPSLFFLCPIEASFPAGKWNCFLPPGLERSPAPSPYGILLGSMKFFSFFPFSSPIRRWRKNR